MNRELLTPDELDTRLEEFRVRFRQLRSEVRRAIVGYEELINECLVAIFSQGHVLLEGVPGLGKTYLVRVLSRVLGLGFGRVQCTPDLMPADLLGTHIVGEDDSGRRVFRFEKGPVFQNLLLVDEINRTTPKTQAALLEVMQEHAVTAGGERFTLPEPFFVLATQNPLEMEGTYPLPEAQLDRFFFKLRVPFPSLDDLVEISRRTSGFDEPELEMVIEGPEMIRLQQLLTHIPIAEPLTRYAASLILASHPDAPEATARIRRYVSYGASPRGLQTMVRAARVWAAIAGRTAVSVDDIRRFVAPALRHRIILNFEGEAEAVNLDELLAEVVESVPTPAREAA
ncbi:MAG TPA: MoxR family ATPase [Pirellulales bacterium]|jgi:MoxR-like ATPase|nr:MoxR family ATPase [Pirellulales bacterium]